MKIFILKQFTSAVKARNKVQLLAWKIVAKHESGVVH